MSLGILKFQFDLGAVFNMFALAFFLSIVRGLATGMALLRSRPFVTYILNTSFYNDNVNVTFSTGKDAKKASVVTTIVGGCHSVALKEIVLVYSLVVVSSDCFMLGS